ncbi:16S rRNA (adenine(1518)-N(6)/adenine(1519)-N(6))-dimethyltransferase RsmA [Bdellovibrio sp. HCB2-146]|uniref:16S rRNA (adenine(1518)-N(6)/adenine(1519)-N(6))- dimethyltransferase RsmA n=1 Tax=Bdellovibrio sp. HCB2-146 TaxID=3394362 RepID=UPI0039BCF8C2
MSEARQRLMVALEELGILAKKSLGQNFLVSDIVIEKIINQVREFQPEKMIEVGPGPGALTFFLQQMNVPLQLIELDSVIAEYWRNKGLPVLEEDALRLDWTQFYDDKKLVFVSNLPYQISSSIVVDRSLEDKGVAHMVLMFQKEVAQRIRAAASTEHYGFLSVIAQTFWKIHTVTDAGPRDFDPPPKVASRVLAFTRIETEVKNRKAFLNLVKLAYAQRRKLLKKNLAGLLSQRKLTEEQLVQWLKELGHKETARAEELSPADFVRLYKHFGFNE